jgi:hypothetical protein
VLSTLVLGALVLAPGIPLALVVGRGGLQRRWSGVAVEGLLLGLSWYIALALVESHAGWYGRVQVLVPTALLVAALAAPAWGEARRVQRPVATWFAGLLAVVTVLAMVLRERPFYFVYQIGDFGEYVNRANAIADGGGFIGWFTQGFTVALSLAHLALGEARTVDLMPFLGIVLLLVCVALAERLGASRVARATVAVILAVGVVPVWFARFPASETLYAVLQVGMVLLVVEAVQRSSARLAVAGGIVCGLLLITRGNGLLLGPIVVVFLFVCALVVSRRTMVTLITFACSALLSLGAAFVYNARFSHPYFIAEQLPKFVPGPIFRQLEGMGGLRFAVPRLLALVVVTALVAVAASWLQARRLPAVLGRVALPAFVAVALLALVTVLDAGGLTDALRRYDIAVELLGALGVVVALWRFADRMGDDERVGVTLVVLLGGAFALLYADRLPTARYAPYFLYWDRYLFSELFPVMVVAAIWAVWLLERGLARVQMPSAALLVPVAALGVVLYAEGAVTREHVFMDAAYEQLRAVDRLAADDGVPIVFAGVRPDQMPPALYHPNTHRVVASPLASTFGRRFLNLGLHPYAPDPQPDAAAVAAAMRRGRQHEAYLVQVAVGGDAPQAITGSGLEVTAIGRTSLTIPMLDRPLDRGTPRWRIPRFTIVVSDVRLP